MNERPILRKQMEAGKLAVGSFLLGHDASVVRVAQTAGLDFLLLDYEHGTVSDSLCSQFIDVAYTSNISLFVRCTMHDVPYITRLFDHGLSGVLVAGATSMEDVSTVISAIKYPPFGRRGLNPFVPSAGYGSWREDTFMQVQNKETHIWILAESQALLKELEQISQRSEIDGVLLGPYDLSVDIGVKGDIQHPKVVAAIDAAMRTLRKNGCSAGIYAKDAEAAAPWVEKGASFVVVGFDWSLLQTAWAKIVQHCTVGTGSSAHSDARI